MTRPKAKLREIWSFHLKIGKYSIFVGLGEVQLCRGLADKFYEVVNREFGGNVDEAMEKGIKLLIMSRRQARHESDVKLHGVNMNETELRNLRFRVIQALLEQDPKLAKMVKGLLYWYEIR